MKITIKNLQQQTFFLDFSEEKSVLELKQCICKERGPDHVVEKQKLIYAGIILEDDRTIKSYNVDEKKFIVLMLKRDVNTLIDKSKATTVASKSESVNNSQKSTEKVSVEETSSTTSAKNESTTATTSAPSNPAAVEGSVTSSTLAGYLTNATLQSRAESNMLLGEEYNRSIQSMMEMGYSRDIVEQAMAASFNNPERAVEYLISGIPVSEEDFSATAMLLSGRAREGSSTNPTDADNVVHRPLEGENAQQDPFEFLRSQPQFLQMRSLVSQNPDLLHAVLQQIAQTNPALLQLISENQDAFLSMLNQSEEQFNSTRSATTGRRSQSSDPTPAESEVEPVVDASINRQAERVSSATETSHRGSNEGEVATIRLTPHDRDAIERLKALGFPEPLVLQAYFACEKNEQLAADFLVTTACED